MKSNNIIFFVALLCVIVLIPLLVLIIHPLTGRVYEYGSTEFGNWAMWMSAIATFLAAFGTIFTFIFLIIQNNETSNKQRAFDRKQEVNTLNNEIEEYNSLLFILRQHQVDKTNEINTTIHLFNSQKIAFNKNIYDLWANMFSSERNTSSNIVFNTLIQKKISILDADELYELYYYFALSKKKNTAKLKLNIERAVYAQKLVNDKGFIELIGRFSKSVVSECIGWLSREPHSHQYRDEINDSIDKLYSDESEFLNVYNNYNLVLITKKEKDRLRDEIVKLLRTNLTIIIRNYFTYLEFLIKETVLLEDSIEYIQSYSAKKINKKCFGFPEVNTVVMYELSKSDKIKELATREVILRELY